MTQTGPTDEQATQFAIILSSGLPAKDALAYFVDEPDPALFAHTLQKWEKSPKVAKALKHIMGKDWQDMTWRERCEISIEWHYSQLALLMVRVNYLEASAADKQKLDTARSAIEAKLAGSAGQMSQVDQFFADLKSGRIKVAAQTGKVN